MKKLNINTLLQIVALILLFVIGYMTFTSSANWELVSSDLTQAKKELQASQEVILKTKSQLKNAKKEFEQMKIQKDLIIHRRDSLLFAFKRKNAKDWETLQQIKDSIKLTNNVLSKDRAVLNSLFGLE